MRVLKYQPSNHVFNLNVEIPIEASIVMADFQKGVPTIWAEVPNEVTGEQRILRGFVTGEIVPEGFEHVHSLMTSDGDFVLHYYRESVQ